jgi:tetratricopeptide (TPR) repeat protein
MSKWVCASWLLFACICVPLRSSAQSQLSSNEVSVRELRIPPKALHAFEQGVELQAKKDAAGSLPHFQRAILEYEGYYEAYDKIGAADLILWRIPEAEQAFRKSIEVSGGQYAHPLLALGAILDDHQEFSEAMTVIRKGLDLDPDSWRGHYYLGLALLGLNRLEEAERSVRETLLRKSDFPRAYLLLAHIHSRTKDCPSLVLDLNEFLKLDPDGPDSGWAKKLRDSAQRVIVESSSTTALAQPQT